MFYQTEMSRSAVRLRAAAGGFVVFLLSLSGVQAQNDRGVTYSTNPICAFKGSTVELSCSYRYPSTVNGLSTTVARTFWFTKLQDGEPFDLRADSEYAGRVQYRCDETRCTLNITDLKESDTAVYKFRLITNHPGGSFTGERGVSLTVTGFQVQKISLSPCSSYPCTKGKLECTSKCDLPGQHSYVWYKNGQETDKEKYSYSENYFYSAASYSCTIKGYKASPSPSVCAHGQSCNRVTYTDRRICAFKGSSVDISCTYNSYGAASSKYWFSPKPYWRYVRPENRAQYAGRVQVFETERGHSTLRISDLRRSDSAEYRFKFTSRGFEWRSSLPGTTLTVTDPDLQVQVIWSSSGPKLICHSSCILGGRSPFVWFKNDTKVIKETSSSYRGYVDPADIYSCAYENHSSMPVYAPTAPSLLISSTGDIMKDTSVTLTCSSKANPAPKYTWYKKNQPLLNKEAQLVLDAPQSSDSGEYYCTAENELERRTSRFVFVDVRYRPESATLSVSPSAEIVEGSSVNLTCSSDANPAANYTWYKGNQTLLQGSESIYNLSSISSEDRGIYSCKSENQYGRVNSTSLFLDVQYAPKLPSVSVSPSAEIVEGSSVNLTCSSDANPAATYTWYKENEDSPIAVGPVFTITDLRAEHNGNYYCEAQNSRGRHNSTLHLIYLAGARISAALGSITAVLLAIIFLAFFLWTRRPKSSIHQSKAEEAPDNRVKPALDPLYGNLSAAQRRTQEQQRAFRHASIRFFQNQADVLYSSVRPAGLHRQTQKKDEEDETEYTNVTINTASGLPGRRSQEAGEESFCLYSTVKPH
ncbi:sialoadhesin-like [Notolabrus celidotus]|uniref:sialoadhesin-like n=1 Tax=Notolabrus celidotus TaxID=1203425 RepID=UPI00148F530A|nr:sialoadhesin-like [Notolabrus celidotus]